MSLGDDIIARSQRVQAIIAAALRTATSDERSLARTELLYIKERIDKELRRIPPEFFACDYHRMLTVEKCRLEEKLRDSVKDDQVYFAILVG